MAGLFTLLFIICLLIAGFAFIRLIKSRNKSEAAKKILIVFGFFSLILIYKFIIEEAYPCLAFGGIYCNFETSSYNSPLFPF